LPGITQLLVDALDCEGPLDDGPVLAAALRAAALEAGAQPVGEVVHRYVPHGVTVALILAESHILLSTWPEHRLALLDVQLCNPTMDPAQVWSILSPLLRPAEQRLHPVRRAWGAAALEEQPAGG
jgi:S-adenosylmethionine decarboxylase